MKFSNETLLDVGKSIVESISSQIRELSEESPLGARIAKKKSGEDIIGGDLVQEATESIARDFVDPSDIKNMLVADAWHVVEDFSDDKIKKLVLAGLTVGVKVFGDEKSREGIFAIVDSIDGSNNLREWITPTPHIATAVALGSLSNLNVNPGVGAIDVAVVSKVFSRDLYYAKKGEGAFFEGWGKLESSPEEHLENAIFGVDTDLMGSEYLTLEEKLSPALSKVKCKRRLCSSILDFCKVASGEYDAFLSLGGLMILSDIAPSKLIVEEAGGVFDERVTSADKSFKGDILKRLIVGGETNLLKEAKFNIVASGNKRIHRQITSELKSY